MSFEIIVIFFLLLLKKCQLFKYEPYNYCDPELKLCENPTDHVMCKYPIEGLSKRCNSSINEPLSSEEKDKILINHNTIRNKIALGHMNSSIGVIPPASNMRQLYWDDELEVLAARWADQCMDADKEDVKDACRNTRRFEVYQNLGTRRIKMSNPETKMEKEAIKIPFVWTEELKSLDPKKIDNYSEDNEEEIGTKDFTAMIWGDTYLIGCARVIFQQELEEEYEEEEEGAEEEMEEVRKRKRKKQTEAISKTLWSFERLVCNYGPRGNVVGKSIYKRGVGCENCPENTTCSAEYPALCRKIGLENKTSVEKPDIKIPTIEEESEIDAKVKPIESEKPLQSKLPKGKIPVQVPQNDSLSKVDTKTSTNVTTMIKNPTEEENKYEEEEKEQDNRKAGTAERIGPLEPEVELTENEEEEMVEPEMVEPEIVESKANEEEPLEPEEVELRANEEEAAEPGKKIKPKFPDQTEEEEAGKSSEEGEEVELNKDEKKLKNKNETISEPGKEPEEKTGIEQETKNEGESLAGNGQGPNSDTENQDLLWPSQKSSQTPERERRSYLNRRAVFEADTHEWKDKSWSVKRDVPTLKNGDVCYCVKKQNNASKLDKFIDKWIFSLYIMFVYFIT